MNIQANRRSSDIEIIEEFKELLVPLTEEEQQLLKEDIQENGCLNPIIIWENEGRNILIDGHNRYRICTELDVAYKIEFLEFGSRNEVRIWIINNQLGRRNLTRDQLSYYRGLQYLQTKKSKGGYQNVLSKGESDVSTSELIASKFNVSSSTIKRDSNYAKGLEMIGVSNNKLKQQILNGDVSFNKKDIQFLGESDAKFKVKNEADLFNKISQLKMDSLNQVEKALEEIHIEEKTVENPFESYDHQVKRIKGSILSYINRAIDNRDVNAIIELKELIVRLEYLISKD